MRSRRTVWLLATGILLLCIALSGCGSSAPLTGATDSTPGSGAPGSTDATTTPGQHAPPHALAWFQLDSHQVGQIWASVNGGAAHQVTHMPASSAACRDDEYWSPPVFSPDLSKIVAAWGGADCSDGPEHGPIYIINAATGAATRAPSTDIRLSLRQTGWMNNSTIWWIKGTQLNSYVAGGANHIVGTLSGSKVEDAVLRGSTLFYTTSVGDGYQLARFDMTSHMKLGGAINLGAITICRCSRGDALTPGFDVSADGAHVVYQVVAPGGSMTEGVGSSQFFYASADGSGASRIATVATTASFVKMQLSPNGKWVAVSRAEPPPRSVFTASVTSTGGNNDPNLRYYESDVRSYPVWETDSTTFLASTLDLSSVRLSTTGDVERFNINNGSSSVGVAGGANPWLTIGG